MQTKRLQNAGNCLSKDHQSWGAAGMGMFDLIKTLAVVDIEYVLVSDPISIRRDFLENAAQLSGKAGVNAVWPLAQLTNSEIN
jgi:hypothetical protein